MLQQVNSASFNVRVLHACKKKLQLVQVHQMGKAGTQWLERQVYPFIQAVARVGQNKSQGASVLDKRRFDLTAHSLDFMVSLVCQGREEDLELHVADPSAFINNREETVIVVLDETALWLKLRGEEKVMVSFKEVLDAQRRRDVRRLIRSRQASEDQDFKEQLDQRIDEWMAQDGFQQESRDMISQFYHAGGDKHRLTLVNISAIKHWFNPDLMPEGSKEVIHIYMYIYIYICIYICVCICICICICVYVYVYVYLYMYICICICVYL